MLYIVFGTTQARHFGSRIIADLCSPPKATATSTKLELGFRMISAGITEIGPQGHEDTDVPTFWLLLYYCCFFLATKEDVPPAPAAVGWHRPALMEGLCLSFVAQDKFQWRGLVAWGGRF